MMLLPCGTHVTVSSQIWGTHPTRLFETSFTEGRYMSTLSGTCLSLG